MMYIIISMESIASQYVFMQWISTLCQGKQINYGLEVLIYTLKKLHEYFVCKIFLREPP